MTISSDTLIKKLTAGFKKKDRQLIKDASEFSRSVREQHYGEHGVLSFDQSLNMLDILQEMSLDIQTLIAGLFHDLYIFQDDFRKFEEKFGAEAALIVSDYGKINDLTHHAQITTNVEEYIRMVFTVARDIRTVLLFVANRYYKLVHLDDLPHIQRALLAERTLTVYAPLAHRLGLGKYKANMENIAFQIQNPKIYTDLSARLSERRYHRERYLNQVKMKLDYLFKKYQLEPQLSGRTKHLLSIYRKMQRTECPFEQIHDLLAIRAIVESIPDCYKALAVVQQYFKPILREFDDYIQRPKLNGYQSLHVLLEDEDGIQFELQIRTRGMHRTAEYGFAAHWKYKEGKKEDESDIYINWLRQHLDFSERGSADAHVTQLFNLKNENTDIFVITPKGDLKRLPRGSTPIDFAFAIHREVGLHCSGARVNGQMVPFETKLKNGDTVEVMTSNQTTVNTDWMKYVQSQKAKSQIRRWVREQMRIHSIKLGEEILLKGLRRYKIPITKDSLRSISEKMKLESVDDLYASVGTGKTNVQAIVQKLNGEAEADKAVEKELKPLPKSVAPFGIVVGGMDNMMVSFGKCCLPIPGDPIVGYITKGKGVTVHRATCRNASLIKSHPERGIDVSWESDQNSVFTAGIRVEVGKSESFIKEATARIGKKNVNLANYQFFKMSGHNFCTMVLQVPNRKELEIYMNNLNKMKMVKSVTRLQYSDYKSLLQ